MEEIYTQTEMEEKLELTTVPKDKYDVQTQSGSVKVDSNTQTPQEQRPVIEMKELSTQHEKRPEPTVHKKLQAIVQPHTRNGCRRTPRAISNTYSQQKLQATITHPSDDACLQTDELLIRDVKRKFKQFHALHKLNINKHKHNTQQLQRNYSTYKHINKKLQAIIQQPLENITTQTDPITQVHVTPPKTTSMLSLSLEPSPVHRLFRLYLRQDLHWKLPM
ncbi:hypothetical protein EWB00_002508 [Schistosoma japonicum]|uniref:Uncharacterized protein n=1 Tax=Schistosoma japonicum TaxID=6182 RepID=A0A4Z2DBQ9_SCHJA|nr:hypothetical protein EWB00_002508 [Schistosoma japonicum]